jgi:acetyl-CoA acetyltransferase family protein
VGRSVIVDAIRTPVGRRGGALAGIHPVDLHASVLSELLRRVDVDPGGVDDHIAGCVSQVGEQSLNEARNAWLAAGFPETVPGSTVDRQCGSSQQAIAFGSQAIDAGAQDMVVASGIEHMSRVPMGSSAAEADPFGVALRNRYGPRLVHQGISAELIAHRWRIGREEQDAFAFRSHTRAGEADKLGRRDGYLVPVQLGSSAGDGGAGPPGTLMRDEGVRANPDRAKMAALEPAFRDERYDEIFPEEIDWTVTAGNASQISDGAAAVLLASEERAAELDLDPKARIVAQVVVGSDPVLMLTGPIPATRKILDRAGLELPDVEVVEINEAFASVVLAWKRELEVDDDWFEEHVNPGGGAIAIGHPLGASGARLMTDLVHELDRREGRYGLQVMCEGGGMSNATLIERLG